MSITSLRSALERVIFGKTEAVDLVLTGLIAGGHVLLEDVPGTGKTTLARALAALIGDSHTPLVFHRVQFTPDLLPYDVTGVDVFNPGRNRFEFQPGPVFSHVLLADEINRATPKVQSALLEVMAEGQVSVGGKTYALDELFMVLATENSVDRAGIYPLPLAQLDRFMLRVHPGYPGRDDELRIVLENPARTVLPELEPVVSRQEILELRRNARDVFCAGPLAAAVVDLVRATRESSRFSVGASPRAAEMLLAAMKSFAVVQGRTYSTDSDLARLAAPVLAHRLVPEDATEPAQNALDQLVQEAVDGLVGESIS